MRYQPTRPIHRRRPPTEQLEPRLMLATQTFSNFQGISLQDSFNPPTPALLYPSAINVEDVAGPITELRATLFGFSHGRPSDVDVLLVGPTGRSVILMSDAGGNVAIPPTQLVDLTFTDTATRALPESTRIAPGLYRPTNFGPDDDFRDNELIDAPTHTTLASLAATNPNGMWRLFVIDDATGFEGGVDGWRLTFVTGAPGPAAPSVPDLHPSSDRGPSNSDNITNADQPVFRGTAAAGTQVRLFVDGTEFATTNVTATGTYQTPVGGISEGTHTLSARALDASGTEGPVSADLTVTFDFSVPEHPTVPDLTPASDTGTSSTDNDTDDTTPTFAGTADGADTVTLLANGVPVGTGPVVNGLYTVTPAAALAPGTYDFATFGGDLAGNNSEPTIPGLSVVIRPGGTTIAQVTGVYVRGAAWLGQDNNAATTTFMEYLEAKGLGDDVMGYRVFGPGRTPPAQNPEDILPWINTDQIVLKYASAPTGSMIPTTGNVSVTGQRNGTYTVTSVNPLPGDPTAYVLALSKPLGGGNPVTGVAPTATENGDRITLGVLPGIEGGFFFTQRMNVLQGDVDHLNETTHNVLARDFAEVKKKFFKNTTSAVGGTDADYSAFHDVDGNGQILARDFAEVKKRFFQNLPAAATAAGQFGGTRIADEVLA